MSSENFPRVSQTPPPPAPPAPSAPAQNYQQPAAPSPSQYEQPYTQQQVPPATESKASAIFDSVKKAGAQAGAKAKAVSAEQAERLKEANAQRKANAAAAGPHDPNANGFFKALFDVNFRSFVTVKFSKLIYILVILLNLAVALITSFIVFAVYTYLYDFGTGFMRGFITLLISLPAALWGILVNRLFLEFVVAMIRTAENTSYLRPEMQGNTQQSVQPYQQ